MKRFAYSLFAAALVALSGCQDDAVVEEQAVLPAQTGDEITFGSALTDVQLRTIYGDDPVNGAYPVYWEDGDQVSIYCPDAAQTKLATYRVTPDENDSTHSAAVTKVNTGETALQWGAGTTHHFSAIYPADRVEGIDNGKLRCRIPATQDPVYWKKTNNGAGITYTGVANTDYAFMWAYGTHDKNDGGDVSLEFKPWVTILDVEINGPVVNSDSVKMSSVQLRSLSGDVLNGEFDIDFTAVEQNPQYYPTYSDAGTTSGTRSQITIQLYDNEEEDFITLRPGDKIVVRFYLLPKDVNYDTNGEGRNDLQIRVAPVNSAVLTRTLNAQGGSQTGGILAHKVNKVILPNVHSGGTNYWMSSLDPNIFVTELSLPGSKFSYQNTTDQPGVGTHYQSLSVVDQMKNGIRAFHVQTYGINEDSDGPDMRDDGGNANSMTLGITVGENTTNLTLKDMVKTVANGLKTAEAEDKTGEYAFVLLTYSGNGSEGFGRDWSLLGGYDWETAPAQAWMQAVKNDLEDMAADNTDTYRLYTGEITPNTTLKDVAGHVIIKVNYNDEAMANYLDQNDQVPALFSIWGLTDQTLDFEDGTTSTSAYAINMLRWGTSNHNTTASMKFFYHEASSVGHEESASDKEHNITDMWERSIDYFQTNGNHDMWFMNDVGGYYYGGGYANSETQEGIDDWTEYIGPRITRYLQSRTEDATLGIVLLNYADPDNPYSGNLIQTIINNNFSFILRTAGQTTQQYNATYNNGGNAIGWDNQ